MSDAVLKQLSLSGFPFQLRVEHEVAATEHRHGWRIETREQAWATGLPRNKSGYIDLVLRHSQKVVLRLIVECKRQRDNDARLLQWLFLIPKEGTEQTELVRCLTVEGWRRDQRDIRKVAGGTSSWAVLRLWDDIRIKPASYESQFCVMQGDTPKERPLLEKLCAELLDSVDGLVEEELEIAKADPDARHLRTFNIPVVVTNARLNLCVLNVGAVSLQDGVISADECRVEQVPFVRFRKSLTVVPPDEGVRITNLKQANTARERTVFIVNAESLADFLSGWEVRPSDSFNGYAVQHAMDRYGVREGES